MPYFLREDIFDFSSAMKINGQDNWPYYINNHSDEWWHYNWHCFWASALRSSVLVLMHAPGNDAEIQQSAQQTELMIQDIHLTNSLPVIQEQFISINEYQNNFVFTNKKKKKKLDTLFYIFAWSATPFGTEDSKI